MKYRALKVRHGYGSQGQGRAQQEALFCGHGKPLEIRTILGISTHLIIEYIFNTISH